jgi:hypothetical protein
MPFLIKSDYQKAYGYAEFSALIKDETGYDNETIWQSELLTTIEIIKGYLRSRYDLTTVFKEVTEHSVSNTYAIGDIVYNTHGILYYAIATVPLSTQLTDTNYWTQGDNRNRLLVMLCVDISLYNMLTRNISVDIPQIRKERYDGNDPMQKSGAIGILKSIQKGTYEPDLTVLTEGETDQTANIHIYGDATEVKGYNQTFL